MTSDDVTAPEPLAITVDAVRATPLDLAVGEADVYLVAEILLGHRRSDRWEEPPTTTEPSPTLSLALARLTPIALLRFIGSNGGERTGRGLRRRGERHDVVDVALIDNDDDGADGTFDLRCSAAWPTVLWDIGATLLPLIDKQRARHEVSVGGFGRTDRQKLRTAQAPLATLTGDHFAYACALEHLSRLGLPSSFEAHVMRGLVNGSPLAHVFRLDDPDQARLDVDRLLQPPLLRAIELLSVGLAASWTRAVRRSLSHSADARELVARVSAVARHLVAFVDAIDGAWRLDLLAPVVALVCELPEVLPDDTRARLLRIPGVTTMADRDRVVAGVAGIFGIVDRLDVHFRQAASLRFGDERFTEARFAAPLAATLAARRGAIDGARHALQGDIG